MKNAHIEHLSDIAIILATNGAYSNPNAFPMIYAILDIVCIYPSCTMKIELTPILCACASQILPSSAHGIGLKTISGLLKKIRSAEIIKTQQKTNLSLFLSIINFFL
ncbi:hypothetical protein VEE05_13730 [Escherichia coli]|nr:hypothetical protein VEGS05_14460 [Escherichia coli]BEA15655.1 hypothetical protein VEE05_13730 [Escherichia coli]BED17194.1 hypothetical protein VEE78_14270 [Escherichia coli]